MKYKSFIITFFTILILIQINFVYASIDTTINLVNEIDGGYENLPPQDIILSYIFNTGERIDKNIKSSQLNYVFLENELFCYINCNLVPKRVIYRTDIKKGDELLSRIDSPIYSSEDKKIIDIFMSEKVDAKDNLNLIISDLSYQNNSEGYIINWNGKINISKNENYSFLLKNSSIILLTIDNNSYVDLNNSEIKLTLDEGLHIFNITYWTNGQQKINLFWKKFLEWDYKIIPDKNLIFNQGYVKKVSSSNTRMMAASSFPNSYLIDYSIYITAVMGYTHINSERTPILLVHGLHGSDKITLNDSSTWTYWNNIPSKLDSLNNDVWQVFYVPANVSNFRTSGLLKPVIKTILQNYKVSKLDVVAHSMGGLMTLGYIENLGKNKSGGAEYYGNNIRKIIFIGSPLHGSMSANRILLGQNSAPNSLCSTIDWFLSIFGMGHDPYDKNAQSYLDLAVGSEFTQLLNKNTIPPEFNSNILAIVGNSGILCVPDETLESSDDPGNGNDGLVSVASASLLDKNIPLIVLRDYNHASEIGSRLVWDFFNGWKYDADREYKSINAFLKGHDKDTIKSYLTNEDYYIDPSDQYSNPFNKGMVVISVTSQNPINSIELRNNNNQYYSLTKYKDVRHNSQTNNWYYFSNNAVLGDTDSKYGLTLLKGNYRIYVNGINTYKDIEIKGAQTSMMELTFSSNSCTGINSCCNKTTDQIIPAGFPPNPPYYRKTYCVNNSRIFINYSCSGNNDYTINRQDTLIENCKSNQICKEISNETYCSDECITPTNTGNTIISSSTRLCRGIYNLFPQAFTIGASNIILDCDGAILIGNGYNIGINMNGPSFNTGFNNITIKNCNIKYYGDGIDISPPAQNINLINNNISNSKDVGMFIYQASNINIINSIFENNSDAGIAIQDTNNSLFINNAFINNGDDIYPSRKGLVLTNCFNNTIHNNTFAVRGVVDNNVNYNLYCVNNTGNFYINNATGPICKSCFVNLINTTWSSWANISCLKNDKMNQSMSKVQYDSNNCGNMTNKTITEYRATEYCNFCNQNIIGQNTSWSICSISNLSTRTIYYKDLNYSKCCAITGLDSDCGIRNKTYENKTETKDCDFCTPNIQGPFNTAWTCLINDSNISTSYYIDSNYSKCCAITNLSSDCIIKNPEYQNKTQNKTCDYCKPNITQINTICNTKNQTITWYNDSNKCFEKTGLESDKPSINETKDCNYCDPIPVKILGDWQDYGECFNDTQKQKRIITEYDSNYNNCYAITKLPSDLWNNGINKTYWEENHSRYKNCCNPNIQGPFKTEWSSCLNDTIRQNYTEYYIDYNYASCCNVTGLRDDCEINYNKRYENRTLFRSCNNCTINSPLTNGMFNSKNLLVNIISTNKTPNKFIYMDYTDKNPKNKTVCTNKKECKTILGFNSGWHNITTVGIGIPECIDNSIFFIDNIAPKIKNTYPKINSYVNSSAIFTFDYEEINPAWSNLYINNVKIKGIDLKQGEKPSFSGFLESYDGEDILYLFDLMDIAGNTAKTRPLKIHVDTTPPIILNPDSFWKKGEGKNNDYIYFDIKINEDNLDEVAYYYNYKDNRDRIKEVNRILCSNLKEGICNSKIKLYGDTKEIKITALDKAGNSAVEIIDIQA